MYVAEKINIDIFYLAAEGAVGLDPAVAPWDEPQIDDGDESLLEQLHERVHDEVGAVRAERLVVQRHSHLLLRGN